MAWHDSGFGKVIYGVGVLLLLVLLGAVLTGAGNALSSLPWWILVPGLLFVGWLFISWYEEKRKEKLEKMERSSEEGNKIDMGHW